MVRLARLAICGAACLAYANSLRCGLVFDDLFALSGNRDVTDPQQPWAALLRNDFWGQDIRSEGSHKSYRCAP